MTYLIEYHGIAYPNISSAWLINEASYDTAAAQPLDGTVFTVEQNNGKSFTDNIFGGTTLTLSGNLSTILNYFETRASLGWGRLRYNWLCCNTNSDTNLTIDWFGPGTDTIINNLILAGQFAMKAGLQGIWFDPEQYVTSPWRYSTMPNRAKYTYDQYRLQVYACARTIAQGWLNASRDFKLFLIKSYYYYYQNLDNGSETVLTDDYGLYAAFIDGIFDEFGEKQFGEAPTNFTKAPSTGAVGGCQIIVGQTQTYNSIQQSDVQFWYPYATGSSVTKYKGNTKFFDSLAHFTSPTWIDYAGFSSPVFDLNNPNNNYFTPSAFTTALGYHFALPANEWVWIFNQKGLFYPYVTGNIGVGAMPAAYITAMQTFRQQQGMF